MGVVDHAQQRPVGGHLRQQSQRGQAGEEPVHTRGLRQTEGRTKRRRLRFGERVEPVQHVAQQELEGGERQLRLGFHTRAPQYLKAFGVGRHVVEQGRLATAGLTLDH